MAAPVSTIQTTGEASANGERATQAWREAAMQSRRSSSPRARRVRPFRVVAAALPLLFVAALLAAGVVRAAQVGGHHPPPGDSAAAHR
jgi:hypothetical protein